MEKKIKLDTKFSPLRCHRKKGYPSLSWAEGVCGSDLKETVGGEKTTLIPRPVKKGTPARSSRGVRPAGRICCRRSLRARREVGLKRRSKR